VSIYRIEYLDGVVASDIPDLPTTTAPIICRAINSRLAVDPVA
jgi:hypothetical protein